MVLGSLAHQIFIPWAYCKYLLKMRQFVYEASYVGQIWGSKVFIYSDLGDFYSETLSARRNVYLGRSDY